MLVKNIVDEDIVNYKKAAMFIGIGDCDWKCCKEAGIPITVCQNSSLAKQDSIEASEDFIFQRYIANPLSNAIVIGGLEPLTQSADISSLIHFFRNNGCNDDFVIYTGFYEHEQPVQNFKNTVFDCSNVVLKVGRYQPNHTPHFDEVLGVKLVSDNQKGIKIC